MASKLFSHLKCSVCLSFFNDPTILPCEHNFCRECILKCMETGVTKCPECRQNFTKQDLKGNRALRNLLEDVQQEHKTQSVKNQRQTPRNVAEILCSEHGEPLKLFCEEDQSLVCIICREGQKHSGHNFKPVKEAKKICENVAIQAMSFISDENKQVGDMIFNQMNEISKSKERYKHLEERIHAQFKTMHDFLREREEKIMKQLQGASSSAETTMKQNALLLEELQVNGNNQVSILESGLKISQPESFLQWWNEEGFHLIEEITLSEDKFRSGLNGNRVISNHFTIGPYENALPLIVWRDMLHSAKQDLVESTMDKDLKLSVRTDIRLLGKRHGEEYFARHQKFHNGYKDNYVENIQTAQIYWEVDIGAEPGWEHGLTVRYYPQQNNTTFLKTLLFSKSFEKLSLLVKGDRLYAVRGDEENLLVKQVIPKRAGVYIDCERRQVVFCNADNMSLIHTMWCEDK